MPRSWLVGMHAARADWASGWYSRGHLAVPLDADGNVHPPPIQGQQLKLDQGQQVASVVGIILCNAFLNLQMHA